MKKGQVNNTEDKNKKSENLVKGVAKTKSMENKKEKNEEPVIIRRAVIINDEEEKKREEEQKRKEQRRKNDVGFIEKNRAISIFVFGGCGNTVDSAIFR